MEVRIDAVIDRSSARRKREVLISFDEISFTGITFDIRNMFGMETAYQRERSELKVDLFVLKNYREE